MTTSDALISSTYTLEMPMRITQSMRVVLHQIGLCNQLGLRSGGRLSGGKKSVHGFADFFMLVCDD